MIKILHLLDALILLLLVLGTLGCSTPSADQPLVLHVYKSQSTSITDNITPPSDNLTSQVDIIAVDKLTGKDLVPEMRIITLTPEQRATMQRDIEQERKRLTNTSVIRFRTGYCIYPEAGTIEESIKDKMSTGNDYYVIQFYDDMTSLGEGTRNTLDQIGCILYEYVDGCAFYAKIPPEALDTIFSLVDTGKVRYLGHIPTEAKIDPEFLNKALANPDHQYKLGIEFFDKATPDLVDSLKDTVQVEIYYYDISNDIGGTAFGRNIPSIISLNHVKWIWEDIPGTLEIIGVIPPITQQDNYLVVLDSQTPDNLNQLLSIDNVTYIGNTTFLDINNKEYPAIVVSADATAIHQIRLSDFFLAILPL